MHAQAASNCRSQHQLNLRLLRFAASPHREEPVMLAQDLLAAKRPVDALQVVEAAMERDPDDSDLLLTLGVALFRSGELEWARRVLVRAVSADEEWAEPWRWLGETLIEAGDRDRGVQALVRAQALDGNDAQVSQILRRVARQDEVGTRVARFFARPELVDPALLLQDLIEDERFDDATKVLGVALADEDDDPDLLLLKGRVERARGQLEAAKDSFERATELDPGWAEAWTELEELHLESGDEDGAREVARHGQAAKQQAEEQARAASIARETKRATKRVAEEKRAATAKAAEEQRGRHARAAVKLTAKQTTAKDEKADLKELSAVDRITSDTDGVTDALIEMHIEVQLDSFDDEAADDSIEMHIEVELDDLDDSVALEAQAEAEAEAKAQAEVEAELEARIIDEQAAKTARAREAAKAVAQEEAFDRAFRQAELEARKRAAEAKVLKLEAEARAQADKEQAQRRAKIAGERADVVASIRLAREAAFKQAKVEAERRVAGSEAPSAEDLEAAAKARAAVEAAASARRKAVREAEARARVRAEKERWEAAAVARAEEAEALRQKARQAAAAQKRWEATASSREAAGQRALSLAIKFVDDARKRAAAEASTNIESDEGVVFELSTLKQAAPEPVFELTRPVFTGPEAAMAGPGNVDAMLDHLLDELLEELGEEHECDTLPGMPLAGASDGGVGMTQADQGLRLRGEGAIPYQPTSSSGFLAAQTQPGITAPIDATI